MGETECIFCRIVKRQAPASFVYEDDSVAVILDIRPLTEGHTLIIPKAHYEAVYDIPDDLIAHIYRVAKITAIAVKEATEAEGITIIQQNGKAAGQAIFHLHVHVVARYEGQRLPSFGNLKQADREKLEQISKKIRDAFKK